MCGGAGSTCCFLLQSRMGFCGVQFQFNNCVCQVSWGAIIVVKAVKQRTQYTTLWVASDGGGSGEVESNYL